MRELIESFENRSFDHRDVVEAIRSGDGDLITEASLGRVYQHVSKAPHQSMGIITAYRAGRTKKQNEAMNKKLGQVLRSAGHGFFKLRGTWRECQDPNVSYQNCPEDKMIEAHEMTFGVVGITKDLIAKLGKKYEQDAVIYLGPETKGEAVLIFRDGSEQSIGKFKPQKIAQAYSRVKGKTFVFEWVPQTQMDAIIEQAMRRVDGEQEARTH